MSPEQNLHTLARRYCEDRIRLRSSDPNVHEARKALRAGVERLDFDALPPLDELSSLLKKAAAEPFELLATTEAREGENLDRPEGPRATAERDLYVEFIERCEQHDIPEQSPLPYRRVLSKTEIADLGVMLQQKWGIDRGYWCLGFCDARPDATSPPQRGGCRRKLNA